MDERTNPKRKRERDIAQTLEEREIGLNSEEGERVRCKTLVLITNKHHITYPSFLPINLGPPTQLFSQQSQTALISSYLSLKREKDGSSSML